MPSLEYYNQIPGFADWLSGNKFTKINEKNVWKYFTVFQRLESCRKKECQQCSGYRAAWDSEDQILSGLIKNVTCDYKTERRLEQKKIDVLRYYPIPPKFKDFELKNLKVSQEVKDIITDFVADFPNTKGLYVYSDTHGKGRTSIMWGIVRALIELGKISNYHFQTSALFFDFLRSEENTSKALTYDILLLDDFGRESAPNWITSKLEAIIEERTWNGKPVILSSVIPYDDWAWETEIDQSILSKIKRATQLLIL